MVVGGVAGGAVDGVAGGVVVADGVADGVVVGGGVVVVGVVAGGAADGVAGGVVVGAVSNTQRRKGLEGEREVAAIWHRYGANVQDLQHNVGGLFDQLVTFPNCILLSDPKRQEVLRIPAWINQAETNVFRAPLANTWVIPFRQSGNRWHPPKWYAVIDLEALARLLA